MKKFIRKYLLSSCLLLSACSHLPPAVENPPPGNISYSQAMQQMDIYQKSTVRWGGIIIDVENLQYQSFIQVLLYPLDKHGRPDLNQTSVGRFLIKSPRFLDPIIYKINAEVTTSGILEGLVERPVDKILLILPVVLSEIIYLWPEYNADSSYPRYNNYESYGYGSYWNYTYSNGGYRTLNPPRFPHHPPPHCGINQIPNGLGCKPKRIRCEGNEAPDGLGGCKTIIPPTVRCEADEVPNDTGGCKPKRIRCEGNEIPSGVGGCVKTAPIQIIDQKPDTSGEQERVRKEEERQRESVAQRQQQEAQERQRQEQESAAQQQQQEAQERQRQEQESAAQQQQQEAQSRQRQEQESAAQQQQQEAQNRQRQESAAQQQQQEAQERQRQAAVPAQKAHGRRNREE